MTALAPTCCACCRQRSRACSRVFSQRSVRIVMLPPTSVCKPAPMVPKIERERTIMPRTTPNVFTIRYPSSSNAVVVMAAFMPPIYKRSAPLHAFRLRFLGGFRRLLLCLELVELTLYVWQILHVEEGDVKHVADYKV